MSGPQGPFDPQLASEHPIDPELRVGRVHLRTADIDRVRDFYVGIMGFDVMFEARDVPGWGTTGDILFLSAGGQPPPPRVPTLEGEGGGAGARGRGADVGRRLVDAGVPLRQLTDHGTHLAVYLSHPDGNDLELAWDRPFEQWPRWGTDEV